MRRRDRILLGHHVRRLAWTLGLCAAGVLGLRIAWGAVAEARLRLAQRHLVAMSPGVVELGLPTASPAGPLLAGLRGFQAMTFRPGAQLDLPWSAGEEKQFDMLAGTNAALLESLDAQADADFPPWFVPLDTIPEGMDLTLGERLRQVQDFCSAGVMLAHQRGRDGEALTFLRRIFTLDRIVLAQPSLAAHSIAANTRARLVALVERIGPTLKVNIPAGPVSPDGATPEAMRGLIAALLDERAFRRQLEGATAWQAAALLGQSVPIDERPYLLRAGDAEMPSPFLRPVMTDERRRVIEAARRWHTVTRAPTFDPFRPWLSPVSANRITRMAAAGSNAFVQQWSRTAFAYFRALADTRSAAVLLAVRLAALEGGPEGRPPSTTERLVPAYLPAPVADPFAGDGRPLRYFADATGVTVWSVGLDGFDDGATASRTSRGRVADQPDLVYGAGWLGGIHGPTTAPATFPAPKP